MHSVRIRPATIRDYDRICELAGQMDRMHREALPDRFRQPDGPNRARDYVAGLIADPKTFLAVAEDGGEALALINCGIEQSPKIPTKPVARYLKVRGLIVDKTRRRQGIGRKLLFAALDWAFEHGAQEVQLNIYQFNNIAEAFFREFGLRPLNTRYVSPLNSRPGKNAPGE